MKQKKIVGMMLSVCMIGIMVAHAKPQEAQAAAVYEPMIVSSGYNYDVIATTGETPSAQESIDAPCGTKTGNSYACFYSAALYSTGGFPTNGIITSESTSNLKWQLGSYTSANALKLNPGGAAEP